MLVSCNQLHLATLTNSKHLVKISLVTVLDLCQTQPYI